MLEPLARGEGQLQGELDREDTWTMASVDPGLLLGQLREEQAELRRRRTGWKKSINAGGGGWGAGRNSHLTSKMGGGVIRVCLRVCGC